jgi:hypothetical protein
MGILTEYLNTLLQDNGTQISLSYSVALTAVFLTYAADEDDKRRLLELAEEMGLNQDYPEAFKKLQNEVAADERVEIPEHKPETTANALSIL